MKEKKIKGYGNIFSITENGDVFKDTDNGKVKVNPIKTSSTIQINLYHNGKNKRATLARLVYSTFVKELKRNEFIQYKDGNFENVSLDNLYVTSFIPKTRDKNNDVLDHGDNDVLLKVLGKQFESTYIKRAIIKSIKKGEKQNAKTESVLKEFFKFKNSEIEKAEKKLKKVSKNVSTLNTLVNKKGKMTLLMANNIQNAIDELKHTIDKL